MDENCYAEWPDKYSVIRVPIEMDGLNTYRAVPGILGSDNDIYDNEALIQFLNKVSEAGIITLKYDTEHAESESAGSAFSSPVPVMRLTLEAYDPRTHANLSMYENIATADYPDRLEVVRRMLSSMGLALVKHETSATTGV
jgi:hypothetical protein